jgi:hypothetical protein
MENGASDEGEGMADVSHYGFLIDRDVAKAASFFPRKRTRTTLQMGLPEDTGDDVIVKLAWERQWIIVTGNGDHFIHQILKFQTKTEKKECHDLSGLIILPNGFEVQKWLLREIEKKLRFGGKQITWADVWYKNYCVRVLKNGNAEITTFPKCLYCRKLQEK